MSHIFSRKIFYRKCDVEDVNIILQKIFLFKKYTFNSHRCLLYHASLRMLFKRLYI